MTTRGGAGAHEWQVEAHAGRYFWVCRCGQHSEPVYGSQEGAAEAAAEHSHEVDQQA